jgi:hypothetical protein
VRRNQGPVSCGSHVVDALLDASARLAVNLDQARVAGPNWSRHVPDGPAVDEAFPVLLAKGGAPPPAQIDVRVSMDQRPAAVNVVSSVNVFSGDCAT